MFSIFGEFFMFSFFFYFVKQVLVSPSSNVPASQAFKGMREDEVFFKN